MSQQRITSMAGLAEIAGCSVMTVSLALRGSAKVSTATRERIEALAAEHGYRANPMVTALMVSRRSRKAPRGETIGLLTKFDEPVGTWTARRSFYSDLHDGMRERAKELGFGMEEFPTYGEHAMSGARLTSIFRARGIRGLILMPGGPMERRFPDFDPEQFAVVAAAFHAREMNVHRTASDYSAGTDLCLRELVKRGYRKIGLTLNDRLDPHVRNAFSGSFLVWQRGIPPRARVPLISGKELNIPRQVFLRWIEKHRPEAILCTIHRYQDYLREAGFRVPEDVACCHLPVRDHPEVSGLDSNTWQVGRSAVDMLARELFLNHRGLPLYPEVLLVKGRWQEGPTVMPSLNLKSRVQRGRSLLSAS